MSLLDTFVMVFQADTRQAQREIAATDQGVEDLDKAVKNVGASAGDTGSALKSMAAGALGALAASLSLGSILSSAFARADNIRAIEQTSDALGIAIEDVDAFGKAAEAMGGDAQGARDSLTDMAEAMGEALADKESGRAKSFQALGIAIADANGKAKDGLTGILDLAGAVEGLSKSEAIFKIKELGITDNRTVEMVLKGRKELERLLGVQKEQGTVTKESAENARKLTEAFGQLKNGLASAGNSFIDSLIPALTKVIEWLAKGVDWMSDHKDFVIGFFGAIAAVVAAVYLPAMISAAAATIAATWPLLAIGAAIAAAAAAFALIYDDVMNFVEGNDSFIGQISEKYPIVGQAVMWLVGLFRDFWGVITKGAGQISGFFSRAMSQIYGGIKSVVEYIPTAIAKFMGLAMAIQEKFSAMGDVVKAVFQGVIDAIKGALNFANTGIDKIKSGFGGVASFFGIGDEENTSTSEPPETINGDVPLAGIDQSMRAAIAQIGAAQASPANSITSNAISNQVNRTSQTDVQIGEVVVQTQATDAAGISKDIGSELQGQLKGLEMESATGVDR